jgi:ribosome-associated protein
MDQEEDEREHERTSKTQRKREMLERQEIGEELVALPEPRLHELDLPERLLDAVLEAKRMRSFGARRRQLQYIGRLMRDTDSVAIAAKLTAWKGQSREATAYLHAIERWRERLLRDDEAVSELVAAHPQADVQRLRALVRNARREHTLGQPPASFRELFQALKSIIPEHS